MHYCTGASSVCNLSVMIIRMVCSSLIYCFFFFNDTATTEIYTLSLHDALPIYQRLLARAVTMVHAVELRDRLVRLIHEEQIVRSEEHTSELQSRLHLVCRLLLEKKKQCPV